MAGAATRGIGAIVVVQDVEDRAIEVARLRADVVAGAIVDLVEQLLLRERRIGLRRADPAEQRGLAIVEREAVRAEHGAGRIVPAEHRGGQLQVESRGRVRVPNQSTWPSRPMVRISSPIQRADRRRRDRVGRFPAERAVLERHRWIERAEPHARAQAGARIGPVLEIGLGEIDRDSCRRRSQRRCFDVRGEHFAERLVERGAQPAELNALVVGVEAQLALAVVEEGFAAVGAHRAQVEREFPVGRACARRAQGQRGQRSSAAFVSQ